MRRAPRLEGEKEFRAIRYAIFRQSPNRLLEKTIFGHPEGSQSPHIFVSVLKTDTEIVLQHPAKMAMKMQTTGIWSFGAPLRADDTRVREGKFLHLRWRGREHLLFATPEVHRYHNQILGHFAADVGIGYRWPSRERLEIDDPELEILGGGRFRLFPRQGRIECWDNSQAYGRFDVERLRSALSAAEMPWRVLTLEIS